MIEKLINSLHVAPLIIILAIAIGRKLYEKIAGRRIDVLPAILLLTSVGIASGFGIHSHVAGSSICYMCFGYAATLAIVALRLAKIDRSITKSEIA